jgi:hypothetical protein
MVCVRHLMHHIASVHRSRLSQTLGTTAGASLLIIPNTGHIHHQLSKPSSSLPPSTMANAGGSSPSYAMLLLKLRSKAAPLPPDASPQRIKQCHTDYKLMQQVFTELEAVMKAAICFCLAPSRDTPMSGG